MEAAMPLHNQVNNIGKGKNNIAREIRSNTWDNNKNNKHNKAKTTQGEK